MDLRNEPPRGNHDPSEAIPPDERSRDGGQQIASYARLSSLEAQAAGLGLAQVMTRSFAGEIRYWSRGMERLYGFTGRRGDWPDLAPVVAHRISALARRPSTGNCSSARSGPANCATGVVTARRIIVVSHQSLQRDPTARRRW